MKKILIVEDNSLNCLLLEEILSYYKVELTFANDGKQFYKLIENKKLFFDLILMDYQLPDTTGVELTKYIIKENLKIPIIFISAFNDKCEEVYTYGVEWYITKPINIQLLISAINKYITLIKN